jgi:hypothetical protein
MKLILVICTRDCQFKKGVHCDNPHGIEINKNGICIKYLKE